MVYDYLQLRNRRKLIGGLALLVLAALALSWAFGNTGLVAKGDEANSWAFAAVLYLCVVLGMLAHAVYRRFDEPRATRLPLDWATFVKPLLASPIVAIPLLAAMQNAEVDLNRMDTARLMVFLVAFENGFCWKEIFDRRRRERADGA